MTAKIKPCVDCGKHKWNWSRNRTVASMSITRASFTSKGLYVCERCKATKYGEPRLEREAR